MSSPDEDRLIQLEASAEKAYDEVYEVHSFSAAGVHYSDAKDFLSEAIRLARELGREDDAIRLEKRLDHIKAVFRSQMSP